MENKHYPSGDTSEHSIFVTREVREYGDRKISCARRGQTNAGPYGRIPENDWSMKPDDWCKLSDETQENTGHIR